MGGRDVSYDPHSFRKHFKNIGRAYREQATTLIEMCRLYVEAAPKTYAEDDRLQEILRLADEALSAAGRANKGTTSEATGAFLRVQQEMKLFGSPPPNVAPAPHRKRLPVMMSTAMEAAYKKDEKATSFVSKVKSFFPTPDSKGDKKKVNFVILKSPHERHRDQPIAHQEIHDSTTTSEIIWMFSRYPENSPQRMALRQNPHFYLKLPEDSAKYDSKFHHDPIKDFAYLRTGTNDTIYVLLDKSCRLFLDAAKPHIPRIFGNLWRPHQKVILKDVVGKLDSEDIVSRGLGKSQDYWYRPSKVARADQSQHRDSHVISKPVGNWRAVVESALISQGVDLMIRDQSMPELPPEWKRLPSDTSPQQGPTNVSTSSFGSTLSATSTQVNRSDTSLTPVAPHLGDSSKDLHLKVPALPTSFQRPPPTAPAGYSLTIPSPLPRKGPRSADQDQVKKDLNIMFAPYARPRKES